MSIPSIFPPGATVSPLAEIFARLPITFADEGNLVEMLAMAQIRLHIDEECERSDLVWAQRDAFLQERTGQLVVPTTIERVAPQNFFIGARPSLVTSSIDYWPSVTTYSGPRTPSTTEQFDQYIDVIDVVLFVEVLCRFGPVPQDELHDQIGIDAEGQVNKQMNRLGAAVQMCIKRDPTLGAAVQPIARAPQKNPSRPMAMPGNSKERTGPYWLYQGMQLRYVVQVNSF